MYIKSCIVLSVLVAAVVVIGCAIHCSYFRNPFATHEFNGEVWRAERNPPATEGSRAGMVADLLANHLVRGMSMKEVAQLLAGC